MKLHLALLMAALLLVAMVTTNVEIGSAGGNGPSAEAGLREIVMVEVDCTTARVSVGCGVISNNTELVHFPAEINMNVIELLNATEVMVGFSTKGSILWIVFNNTEVGGAEKYANFTVETYFEPVFGLGFTYNSTSVNAPYVNVTFTGSAVANLTEYTEWLMMECLASDLGGFSLTFIPMTYETGAYTFIGAMKESCGFDWMYSIGVMYSTTILDGPGEHTVDVLSLLDVEALAPSPYSEMPSGVTIAYMSTVILTINSNTSITFVSCEPGQASPPERGWYVYPPIQPTQIQATFSFGNDSSPVTALSLTFSGMIIPEFTMPMLMTFLTFATAIALALRKRFFHK